MDALFENDRLVIENLDEFYKDMVDNLNGSLQIVKVDENGSTLPIWMNDKYTEIMGYNLEERHRLGFNYKDDELYHPDDIQIIRKGAEMLINHPNEMHSATFRIKTKEGNWKWVHSFNRSITINGNPNFLCILMVEINEYMLDYQRLTEKYVKEIKSLKNELTTSKLTKTEKEIIKKLVLGKSSKEIACECNRSYETINNHKRNIFKKLEIHKLSELIAFAVENGIN